MNPKIGRLYIGTSNVIVPGNKLTFPPAYQSTSRLHYYASLFNTVEINSSFYKLPMPATFKKWGGEAGPDFLFSVKLSKEVTHNKKLVYDAAIVKEFMNAANELGAQRGCVLIQFPGKAGLDYYNKLEDILQQITEYDKKRHWHIAVECRNKEWYVSETTELLESYQACMVLHDMPSSAHDHVTETSRFVYIRFHGKAGDYRGTYTSKELKSYSIKIENWLQKGKTVYVYFNNSLGSAYDNAITLKGYLKQYFTSYQ